MTFIARPSSLFKRYVRSTGSLDLGSYQMGMMAMALEIITQIKMLEEIKVMDDFSRAEAVSALQTLLTDCGLSDPAYEMYERLNEWRALKFEPIHPLLRHDEPVLELPRSVSVVSGNLAALQTDELSLGDVSPPAKTSRGDKPLSSPEERRGLRQDPPSNGELAAQALQAEIRRQSE